MSETTKKGTSAGATWGMIFIGVVLAMGGTWIAVEKPLPGLVNVEKTVGDMGIPIEFGKTIAAIGVFLAMFKLIEMFFFNPLHDAIDGRTQELEKTFSEAESLRNEISEMKASYEKRIADTEANAREEINAQIKEAQDLKKQLMADAQKQADDYKQSAIKEIDAEKNKVVTQLRVNVADLSLQAAEKILNENVDNDRNRKLVDDFLNTVEQAKV